LFSRKKEVESIMLIDRQDLVCADGSDLSMIEPVQNEAELD
jgi:hypothetical protein